MIQVVFVVVEAFVFDVVAQETISLLLPELLFGL